MDYKRFWILTMGSYELEAGSSEPSYLTTVDIRCCCRLSIQSLKLSFANYTSTTYTSGKEVCLQLIVAAHPGDDGTIRVVTVKTANGAEFKRAVTEVCFLPLDEDEN
uniref:DUF5641 domain-containing protein n=1 Tax=Anopheles stephensi TaxID=30069 RepID=A0A182YSX3_ANOST